MLIFSVSFQFYRMSPRRGHDGKCSTQIHSLAFVFGTLRRSSRGHKHTAFVPLHSSTHDNTLRLVSLQHHLYIRLLWFCVHHLEWLDQTCRLATAHCIHGLHHYITAMKPNDTSTIFFALLHDHHGYDLAARRPYHRL
jgi:hypothetical protein